MEALVVRHIERVDPGPTAGQAPDAPHGDRSRRRARPTALECAGGRLDPLGPGSTPSCPAGCARSRRQLDDRADHRLGRDRRPPRPSRCAASATRARYRNLPWDLKSVPMVRQMLPSIRRPEWRTAAEQALDRYDATIAPGLGVTARPGGPRRPDHRQRPRRRRRPDHRDHRLRRHEPHRADHRPRLGARLAGRSTGRRRDLPGARGSCSTATSGSRRSRPTN